MLRAFVSKVRRSEVRYAGGVDADPEVLYERMPTVHFAIDGMLYTKMSKTNP